MRPDVDFLNNTRNFINGARCLCVPGAITEVMAPREMRDKLVPSKSTVKIERPAIVDVKTYNDRVVIVYFEDGSFTKAVCAPEDEFNLDTGITVCLMKRALRKDAHEATKCYNKLMRDIHRLMERKEKKQKEEAEAAIRRSKNMQKKIDARKKKQEEGRRIITERIYKDLRAEVAELFARIDATKLDKED